MTTLRHSDARLAPGDTDEGRANSSRDLFECTNGHRGASSPAAFDPDLSAELDALDSDREAVHDALRATNRRARKSPAVGAWYAAGHALLGQIDAARRSVQVEARI